MACLNDDMDTMVFMVQRMKQRGIDPDVVTYSSIVHAYARRGDVASSMFLCALVCVCARPCMGFLVACLEWTSRVSARVLSRLPHGLP